MTKTDERAASASKESATLRVALREFLEWYKSNRGLYSDNDVIIRNQNKGQNDAVCTLLNILSKHSVSLEEKEVVE